MQQFINHLLAFFRDDPLVAWLLTFALLVVLAALVIFRRWRAHEERHADLHFRRSLRAVIGRPERPWPAPPGPKGFTKNGHQRRSPRGDDVA